MSELSNKTLRILIGLAVLQACGSGSDPTASGANAAAPPSSAGAPASSAVAPPGEPIRYRKDVTPVTRAQDALKGVFIPPYEDCRDPNPGESATGPGSQVCTHVMISGCTEPGKYFPDYASCDVVRTQRPFWEAPPANVPRLDDPRLKDQAFMSELAWLTQQLEASGCSCCHDSRAADGRVGQWDIHRGPIWLDTLSDTGLALFVGLADSSALGAYPAAENHGFDRTRTGVPTTDAPRMQQFLRAEMQRRGITEAQARAVPPFGGPIYANRSMPTGECHGQGVDADGRVQLADAALRYLYVMEEGTANPGVPPNMDLPNGTLWRLDVLASHAPLQGSLAYGSTPEGSFQTFPAAEPPPALQEGRRYKLYGLRDVGLPVINCAFVFGAALGNAPSGGGSAAVSGDITQGSPGGSAATSGSGGARGEAAGAAAPSGGACSPNDAGAEFGSACKDGKTSSDCPCAPANYCAIMPGQSEGYCTAQGCKANPSICPSGWSCFDLSAFSPGLQPICLRP